jgi:predicted metal-dependent HD superfamily phosphohydrolase
VTVPLAAWLALVPDADPVRARATGEDLRHRWAEPHRRYHTLDHLADMLRVIDAAAGVAEDADAVRLAAWYHDAVYDPIRTDNEERSAALATAALPPLQVAPARVAEVARLVRLTAGHAAAPGDRDGALLCDADLAILAAPADRYAAYARAIRAEYAHVPEPAFRAGRSAVLRGLADRPALFWLHPEWEAPARANILTELRAWDGAGPPTPAG